MKELGWSSELHNTGWGNSPKGCILAGYGNPSRKTPSVDGSAAMFSFYSADATGTNAPCGQILARHDKARRLFPAQPIA